MEILYILFFIYLFNAVSFDWDCIQEERRKRLCLPPPCPPYAYKKVFTNRVEYYNSEGHLHRTDGPAREYFNGMKVYIINGHKFSKEEFDKLQTI